MNHITSLSGIPTNLKRLPWLRTIRPFRVRRIGAIAQEIARVVSMGGAYRHAGSSSCTISIA